MEPTGKILERGPKSRARNDSLFDPWSIVHMCTGAAAAWVVHPMLAWFVMALWEPFEIFLLHPLVYRLTGYDFGYESLRNSLSDLVYNTAGVLLGYYLLRALVDPPFLFP